MVSILAGCSTDEAVEVSRGFFGGVAADEPRAALEARDILVEGGSAADAAVAMYFTLAVTLPSSAGLFAGGNCLVFDPAENNFQRLSFPTQASAEGANAVALPTGPRAMFTLHARHGRKRFEELLARAEQIARFGERISKQFAGELRLGVDRFDLKLDRTGGFSDIANLAKAQGEVLVQLDLAATLGRLRARGLGELYQGETARRLVKAAGAAGYAIDPMRLRQALPRWQPVEGIEYDNHIWSAVGARAAETALAERVFRAALTGRNWGGLDAAERPHFLAEAARTDLVRYSPQRRSGGGDPALGAISGWEPVAFPGATSFMAVDRRGLAIGCAISMNAPFGTGTIAEGLGVFFAPPAVTYRDSAMALATVVGNLNVGQTHLAATASGGRGAVSALVSTTLDHYIERMTPAEAIEQPRTHYAGGSDVLYVEPGVGPGVLKSLAALGYTIGPVTKIGRVQLFRCADGIPRAGFNCTLAGDRRGAGLALFEADGG